MSEVPWPKGVDMPAVLACTHAPEDHGYLHFYDPAGERAVICVTRGATYRDDGMRRNVWHIDDLDSVPGDVVVVSPSIHFFGHFHSPNPVRFRLVTFDELHAAAG